MKIEITPELLAELKEKARKITQNEWPPDYPLPNEFEYISFANPAVTLALITKIEQLEKEADLLAEQASMMCDCIENCDECRLFFDCGCNGLNIKEVWRNVAKDAIKDNEQADK